MDRFLYYFQSRNQIGEDNVPVLITDTGRLISAVKLSRCRIPDPHYRTKHTGEKQQPYKTYRGKTTTLQNIQGKNNNLTNEMRRFVVKKLYQRENSYEIQAISTSIFLLGLFR